MAGCIGYVEEENFFPLKNVKLFKHANGKKESVEKGKMNV